MIFRLRRQKRTGREQVEERPDGDFRDISVCPTKRDLHITPQIRKNKEHGGKLSWSSKLTLGYDIDQTTGKPLELCSNVFLIRSLATERRKYTLVLTCRVVLYILRRRKSPWGRSSKMDHHAKLEAHKIHLFHSPQALTNSNLASEQSMHSDFTPLKIQSFDFITTPF